MADIRYKPKYLPLGDRVLVVQFELEVSKEINTHVHNYAHFLREAHIEGVKQIIPTYSSLAVYYDPVMITHDELVQEIKQFEMTGISELNKERKVIKIPVVYGGEYGPDLDYVAEECNLTTDEVIKLHSEREYLIYMLGFIASFPYCGDLNEKLSLPRRTNPRLKVRKGTIAIANLQSIIYALETPGGWHNIGITPLETFNPYENPPTMFTPGDYIKFVPITFKEMEEWDQNKEKRWHEKWNFLE